MLVSIRYQLCAIANDTGMIHMQPEYKDRDKFMQEQSIAIATLRRRVKTGEILMKKVGTKYQYAITAETGLDSHSDTDDTKDTEMIQQLKTDIEGLKQDKVFLQEQLKEKDYQLGNALDTIKQQNQLLLPPAKKSWWKFWK